MTAQTSRSQNVIQSVVDQQNRLFANTVLTPSLEEYYGRLGQKQKLMKRITS